MATETQKIIEEVLESHELKIGFEEFNNQRYMSEKGIRYAINKSLTLQKSRIISEFSRRLKESRDNEGFISREDIRKIAEELKR